MFLSEQNGLQISQEQFVRELHDIQLCKVQPHHRVQYCQPFFPFVGKTCFLSVQTWSAVTAQTTRQPFILSSSALKKGWHKGLLYTF
jgi:hypothetical protein